MLCYDQISVPFYEIFSNPLIKWLWGFVFIKMKPMLLVNHLRRIRSYPFEGEARFMSFMIDLKAVETNH